MTPDTGSRRRFGLSGGCRRCARAGAGRIEKMTKRIRPCRIQPFGHDDEARACRFGRHGQDHVMMMKPETVCPQLDDLALAGAIGNVTQSDGSEPSGSM